MKENDKNIEKLIDKIMAESSLQSPSIDFTSKIMSQILVLETSKIKTYKPLISKQIWILIIGALIIFTFYTIMSNNNYDFNHSVIYTPKIFNLFSGIHLSKNSLYAILIVPFMILIQIPILKNYYYKKYQL